MGKYDPLTRHLEENRATELPMSFGEIERILGAPLPPSKRHPAWWSNNGANNVMTRAWLKAGYRTEQVDIAREQLVFRRREAAANPVETSAEPKAATGGFNYDRLKAYLAGTVTIAPGADIYSTGERWEAEDA